MKHFALILAFLAFQEDPVDSLITKLGHEKIEEREKAAAELVKLGDAAMPKLEKELGNPDAEIRAQVGAVIQRIQRIQKRLGSRLLSLRQDKAGTTRESQAAVLSALKWLTRHQAEDGSWEPKDYADRCARTKKYEGTRCDSPMGEPDSKIGVTALAVLAFLGAGHGPTSKETHDDIAFGGVVGKGIAFLQKNQEKSGCLDGVSMRKMYAHSMATMALVEAALMDPKNDELSKAMARATRYLTGAQNRNGGWRYTPRSGDSDSSVTTWATLASRLAWHAGEEVPNESFDDSLGWFGLVSDEFAQVGYTHKGTGKVFTLGINENFDSHPTFTAGAGIARLMIELKPADPKVLLGVRLLESDLPEWTDTKTDFYYWHLAALFLYHAEGAEGAVWKRWNTDLTSALLGHQRGAKDGCKEGSWDPSGRWCQDGGRVAATAMNALTLETVYRYPRVK